MRTTAAIKRPVAILTLALTTACSSIQAVPVEYISEYKPQTVDLYIGYGRHVAVDNPQLVGDSVVGTDASLKTVVVPLEQVERISAKRYSSAKTVLLIGGVAVLSGLAVYALVSDGSGDVMLECEFANPVDVYEREACGFSMRTR